MPGSPLDSACFRVSGFEFRASGFGIRVSGVGFRVPVEGLAPSFEFWVQGVLLYNLERILRSLGFRVDNLERVLRRIHVAERVDLVSGFAVSGWPLPSEEVTTLKVVGTLTFVH